MESFSLIVGIIVIILLVALVVTLIKYSKNILIDLPVGIIKSGVDQFLSYAALITLPIWLPFILLDTYFKWGIFNHKFFKIFNSKKERIVETNYLPDFEYKEFQRLDLQFSSYEKYFISSINDSTKLLDCLREGLDSIGRSNVEFKCKRIGNLHIAQSDDLKLYEFQYLIQCMDSELRDTNNYGFAVISNFSFFGVADKKSLNNIIGKTSKGDVFAYSLYSGQEDYLSLIDKSNYKSKYSTKFFEELLKKAGNKR